MKSILKASVSESFSRDSRSCKDDDSESESRSKGVRDASGDLKLYFGLGVGKAFKFTAELLLVVT